MPDARRTASPDHSWWPSQVDAFAAAAAPLGDGDAFTRRVKGLDPSGRTDAQRDASRGHRSRETALDRVYDDLGFSRKLAHEAIAHRVAGELGGSGVWPTSTGRYGTLTGRLDRLVSDIAATLYTVHEA